MPAGVFEVRIGRAVNLNSKSRVVDPAIHNSNTREFIGRRLRLPEGDLGIDLDDALASIREFMIEHGSRPTAESWTAAGMTPSEKTIRRRFGSFRSAIEAAERLG